MWKLLSVQDYSFSIFKDSTFKQSFTLKCRHDCVSPLRNKESEQRHNPTKVSVLAKWRKTRCSERCHAITLSKKACSVLYSISSNSTSYTCRCTQTFCAENPPQLLEIKCDEWQKGRSAFISEWASVRDPLCGSLHVHWCLSVPAFQLCLS